MVTTELIDIRQPILIHSPFPALLSGCIKITLVE
jgi:hypothetical protein